MGSPSTSKRLFFVHIPKCAGSTMDYLLRFQFGIRAMNVRDHPASGRVNGANLAFANRLHPWFSVASGHGLFLSPEIKARSPGSFWFTVLREPRARYLSHHAYLAEKKGLQEDLLSWARARRMRNLQTRWLAGEENVQKAIDAMETLFDNVGRMDAFEQSLAQVSAASGIDLMMPRDYKKNVTKSAPKTFTDEVNALVEENNRLDFELWRYFDQHIWPRQVAAYPEAKTLKSAPAVSLGDRANASLNMAWRSAAYIPALKVRSLTSKH